MNENMSKQNVLYDPTKTFEDNFDNGPFPDFKPDKLKTAATQEPSYSVLGYPVGIPFGIPAGPLPTSKHVALAFQLGFDVVCYKTQRTIPFEVNQFPHVLSLQVEGDLTLEKAAKPLVGIAEYDKDPTTLTITNSFGNPSRGADFWAQDLQKALDSAGPGQLLIMSVVGTIQDDFTDDDYFDDFAAAARIAADAGAPVVELNLSCPNVASEGVLCYTPSSVVRICQKARAAVGDTPLVAKLGYFSAEQQNLLEEVIDGIAGTVQAVSAINTITAAIVDENGNQALPGKGRLRSGCCGAGIKWAGLDMTRRLKKLRHKKGYDLEIFGVGGVMTGDDFQKYRQAGADCVQSATGAMWNPYLAHEIKDTEQQ